MKRKGETLTEFLTASTVFGLVAAGIFEFMASQTETLADIRNKDEMIYQAQRYMNTGTQEDGVTCGKSSDGKTLTVTLKTDGTEERASMTFTLKP
ncbi:MAG: hypothetical protein IJG37_02205 [Synergistaceae bacterium]|nr:hypothetical protein [Synergistaceae bacterium]MBQ6972411.1 hypothetical protein [Synergistaceae bacterium]